MGIIAKQSIKGALANYLGVLIGAVTTFFVVTDLLTQEEIGLTRVMVDAAMLFAGLAQLGTNASILRFYPRFKDPEHRDHGFFGWTLVLPLIGFAIIATLFFIFKSGSSESGRGSERQAFSELSTSCSIPYAFNKDAIGMFNNAPRRCSLRLNTCIGRRKL